MAQASNLPEVYGTNNANNGAATATVIAAQGVGKIMRLKKGILTVATAAAGGSGVARITDGTTTIFQVGADAIGSYPFDFGENGFPLATNAALSVVVASAVTTQATAYCAAVCNVAG
jgi:hypothetical protein